MNNIIIIIIISPGNYQYVCIISVIVFVKYIIGIDFALCVHNYTN